MTPYKRIAIDTSKAVFTLHGIDQHDRPVLRTNLRRAQMIPFFKKLPPTESHWKLAAARITGLGNWSRLATRCV
jgi:transposase